jgi:aspartate aminotransferase-like enzyme
MQVKKILGAETGGVFLATGSGTFGVELVLRSCLSPKDKVLALVMGTFSGRMADLAELTGANVIREIAPFGDVVSNERLEFLLSREKPDIVIFAHVEPSTGTQFDLPTVAALCRKLGAIPIVDGVCAGFAIDVDFQMDNLGAYVTASQKGLSLPPGLAIGVVNDELLLRAQTIPESKTGSYGHLLKWTSETLSFTPPILNIFALEESLDYITTETMKRRETRHREYSSLVKEWGRSKNLRPVPAIEEAAAWTLSAFYYPSGLNDAWLVSLRDHCGLELAPSNDPRLAGRYFRIGHLGDLPREHLVEGLSILDREIEKSLEPTKAVSL